MFTITFYKTQYVKETAAHLPKEIRTLVTMNNSELAILYNMVNSELFKIGKVKNSNPVDRFSDKKTAITRTWNALVLWNNSIGSKVVAPEQPKIEEKKTRVYRAKSVKKPKTMDFNFERKEIVKIVKDKSTLRSKVMEKLKVGATFEEVVEVVKAFDDERIVDQKNVVRRAYEVIRLINHYLGYGLHHDLETGIITLK